MTTVLMILLYGALQVFEFGAGRAFGEIARSIIAAARQPEANAETSVDHLHH